MLWEKRKKMVSKALWDDGIFRFGYIPLKYSVDLTLRRSNIFAKILFRKYRSNKEIKNKILQSAKCLTCDINDNSLSVEALALFTPWFDVTSNTLSLSWWMSLYQGSVRTEIDCHTFRYPLRGICTHLQTEKIVLAIILEPLGLLKFKSWLSQTILQDGYIIFKTVLIILMKSTKNA